MKKLLLIVTNVGMYVSGRLKNSSAENDRTVDIEFAQAFDAVGNIVVFSQSLNSPEGEKTKIVRTGLPDETLKLKQQQGKNILTGGATIPSHLATLGLITIRRIHAISYF